MIKQNLSGVTLIDKKGVRVNPNIHLGESDGYISGDILDANAVQGTVNEAVLTAKEDIEDLITDLIGSAPEVLDTLAELADAIGDDPDFFNTINNELDHKVDKVSGKGLSTNDYTTEEKDKLAGIATGAEVNVQSDWSQTNNGADDYIKNKPTNVSAFTNDAGYLTQHQDISGKEDVTTIVAPVDATDATLPVTSLTTEAGKYYRLDVPVETLAVTLPAMGVVTSTKTVVIYLTAGTTPDVTITAADNKRVVFQNGYEIEAGKTYKVNALFDGGAWIVTMVEIFVPPMNIITYEASAKLAETTRGYNSGLHTNAFSGTSGQLTMTSHTFENGIGTIEFDGDVTGIGTQAFFNCSGLTSVIIPDSVTNIGASAFEGCSGLTGITIPSSVTSIDDSALQGCTGLTSIVVDSANTIYDSRDNCNAIINTSTNELVVGCKNTIIPNTVTSIGSGAFHDYTSLTSITIPDSVTNIGSGAFNGCTSLTSITIPDSVTSIGDGAFHRCSRLTNITIPDRVTSIGFDTFNSCSSLTSVTIPSSVTSIGDGAFTGCTGLTSVIIGSGVTSIGNGAFNGCSGLTSVTIPSGVTSIGYGTFSDCSGLTSVTIGSGVTSIGNYAFNECPSLTSIISLATKAPTIQSGTFNNVKIGGTLTVPTGSSGYDTWMGTGNFYLGKYGWTKVEQ